MKADEFHALVIHRTLGRLLTYGLPMWLLLKYRSIPAEHRTHLFPGNGQPASRLALEEALQTGHVWRAIFRYTSVRP